MQVKSRLTVVPTPDTVTHMQTIHYDNGFGLPACGVLERARLSRNPNDVGCYACEKLVPVTAMYQLPNGEIVAVHTEVARGAATVSFQMCGGQVVDATRYEARR